jgi:thymidylate kinase
MIIDFIGAPGVGKSTFARELAARLHAHGRPAKLVSSYRPAENVGASESARKTDLCTISAVLRRLGRPAAELIGNARGLARCRTPGALVDSLMVLLPPRSMIWSIRLQQYLLRLAHSWRLATKAEQITLFDQGFLQALCSLVVLGGGIDRERIALAVALLPLPDLVVHLTAPVTVLEQRLHERNARQGRLERLLELDMRANLEFVPVVDEICELLRLREQRILRADCSDDAMLRREVRRISGEVMLVCGSSMVAEA